MAQAEFLNPPMPDIIAQWLFYLSVLQPQAGQVIIDVGCNTGETEKFLVQTYPAIGKVIGLENNLTAYEQAVTRWQAEGTDPRIEFKQGDAHHLPFPDNEVDGVLCVEMLEWAASPLQALAEIRRVVKVGGWALIIHTDFETQVFSASDKQRCRKIVQSFADAGPNGQMGRELYGLCKKAQFERVEPSIYPLVNQNWSPDLYSYKVAYMMVDWLKQQALVPTDELNAWLLDLEDQQARNLFFYSINRYLCHCQK
jgi:ubiquinone/menaquinone biosynthesis C-methylase UbiE